MKKTYLLIIAAALAFAGCSKAGPELPSDPDAWKWDESLPVPIMFGTPETEVMTKAGVSTLTDMEEIGIVGLDYSGGWKAISEHNPGSNSGEKSPNVLIDATQPATIDGSGNITFSKTPYYPISGSQNFTFYGFYPHSNEIYMGGSSRYYADLTIDGKTDVLWAEAKAEDFIFRKTEDNQLYRIKGYNAAYTRRINEYDTDADGKPSEEYIPKLKFVRKLTNLTFKLRVYESEWAGLVSSETAVTGLSVTSYTKLQMTVADRRDYDSEGNQLFIDETDRLSGKVKIVDTSIGTMDLSGVTAVRFSGAFESGTVEEDENRRRYREFDFGDALLLYPSESYPSVLTLTQGTEEDIKTVSSSLNLTLGEGKSFQEGKKHILTIIIKKPEEITMKAEDLVGWGDGDDNIIDPMNPSNETPVNLN